MLLLRLSPTFCATRRVTTSELPPGGNGTTMVIGREGKLSVCAVAGTAAAIQVSSEHASMAKVRTMSSLD